MSNNEEDSTNPRWVVVGGFGFVGRRLCEMLVDRASTGKGNCTVVAFDCSKPPPDLTPEIIVERGSITDEKRLREVVAGAACVFNCAALVGPYHPHDAYMEVNYRGTLALIEACKATGVPKLVMTSTPSSRFNPWSLDILGARDDELPFPDQMVPPRPFVAEYARTKAMGERACRAACCPELLTVAMAPHQVYGPRDRLMMPNILRAARRGLFRVFGDGDTAISMTYVDNFCHGLMLAEKALKPGSSILGGSYIITDGPPCNFWRTMDHVVTELYGPDASIFKLYSLPEWFILSLARVCDFVTAVTGYPLKLNSFAAKMLMINRYFDISNAQRDLGYAPVVTPEDGWSKTIDWLRANDDKS